ncbi:MAG TPA: DnaB-like helicase C-terminal domain-containing protein [Phycisphaerae bacterium]|nr:DnaB-like helicase C-terminal domain-containing protein [Phycisphaerae bacterium]
MILDNAVISRVGSLARPADFLRPAHQAIFRAVVDMDQHGVAVDLVTLRDELEASGTMGQIFGGMDYIVQLVQGVPAAYNWAYYARQVVDASRRRELVLLCQKAELAARDSTHNIDSVVDRFQQRAYEIGVRKVALSHDDSMGVGDAMQAAFDHAEGVRTGTIPPGLMLGFANLDMVLGGLQPGDLMLLGAPPAGGKSAFATNVMVNVLRGGGAALACSREMKPRELGKRMLQATAGMDGDKLKRGSYYEGEIPQLEHALEAAKGWPGWIDSTAQTAGDVLALARQKARTWGRLDLVVVDYLQLLHGKGDNRAQVVGGVVYALKDIAMSLGCPLLLLSQFNRASNKAGEPPCMFDFKESGDIEQAANEAVLLWSHPRDVMVEGVAKLWLKVAKQRDGSVTPWPDTSGDRPVDADGSLSLWWQMSTTLMYSA